MSVLEKDVDEQKAVENARRVEEERLTQQEKLYQVSCQTVCLSVCLSIRRTVTYSCLLQIPMTVAGGGVRSLPPLSVCLSVFPRASNTDAARIININFEMFHDEYWKPIYLGSKGQRSRSRVTKHCRLGSLHSCECWLLLVFYGCLLTLVTTGLTTHTVQGGPKK